MFKLNEDRTHVDRIIKGAAENEGYCPCTIEKTEKTECPFFKTTVLPVTVKLDELCGESIDNGYCQCNLYVKVDSDE